MTKRTIWIFIGTITILLILVLVLPYVYLSGNRQYKKVRISADGYQLNGYLGIGNDPQGAWIVMTHGNRREGQSLELYQQIRNNLSEEFAVLAIDFYGFGESSIEGLSQGIYTLGRIDDIEAAVEYLKGNYGVSDDQIVLIGHSMGASRVMRAALDHNYRLAIPIGLGDWDSLLANPKLVLQYSRKFSNNTGVFIEPEGIKEEGEQFTADALFSGCPETPVRIIFASFDDGRIPLDPYYQDAHSRCLEDVQMSVIPLSDHMYGSEKIKLPQFIISIRSRFLLSLLIWRLDRVLALR